MTVRAKRMPQKLEATIDHQTHEISKTCNLDRVVTAANGLYGHRLEVLAKIAEVFEKLDNGEGGDARHMLDDYITDRERISGPARHQTEDAAAVAARRPWTSTDNDREEDLLQALHRQPVACRSGAKARAAPANGMKGAQIMTDDTGVGTKKMSPKLEAMIKHHSECIAALRSSFQQLSDQAHEIGALEQVDENEITYRRIFHLGRLALASNSLCGHRLTVLAEIADAFAQLDDDHDAPRAAAH
jgi:hypothetical protein